MKMNDEPIIKFRGEYGWLSNFHEETLEVDSIEFRCAEAAFQAGKTSSPTSWLKLSKMSGQDAKKYGRYIKNLRADWAKYRLERMKKVIRAKFENPKLRDRLLATGNRMIIEGNTWGDDFWGVSSTTGIGENHLGKIIMEVREEIRSGGS